MRRIFWTVIRVLISMLCCTGNSAADSYRQQMQGLDEQVQEIKSDVLSIDAELSRLEERLLYPSNTHVALFVALGRANPLRLDAMHVQIDGQQVAHYIYSFKELEALQQGGVQRIYTGNIASGEHQLEITAVGKLDGKEYSRTERFTISKGVEPKLVGITLGAPEAGGTISIGDW